MARVPILTLSLLQAPSSLNACMSDSVSNHLIQALLCPSACCLGVLYILDTCRLQVTKVTKGALNASQSEEARDSIVWRGLNTCFAIRSILIPLPVHSAFQSYLGPSQILYPD